jgi:hypothetical protein
MVKVEVPNAIAAGINRRGNGRRSKQRLCHRDEHKKRNE